MKSPSSENQPDAPWRATMVSIVPEMFEGGPLGHSIIGKARERGLWSLDVINPRDFATDRHASVDDEPYGGGAGMVMRADVVGMAMEAVLAEGEARPILCMSARGERFTQKIADACAAASGVVILCGRFEGIDQRVIDAYGMREVAVGDAVLSGGESAAILALDACIRLIPGVVGRSGSLDDESFRQGLLEYPQYTRPRDWGGHVVPDVLLSGHHGQIETWRHARALETTQHRRPDLLKPDAD